MGHTLAATSESEQGVTFTCSNCSAVCEFVKPDYGTPNPIPDGSGGWTAPDNPEQWMGPCNAEN